MDLPMTQEWLLRMAEREGNGFISVGGLVARIEAQAQSHVSPTTERGALAHLVEWQRRKLRLTIDALANRADVELEDVLAIENGDGISEPRTLSNLAAALRLPAQMLMQLAGLLSARDPRLEKAALRFAASSASIGDLTPEQSAALEEFVNAIAE